MIDNPKKETRAAIYLRVSTDEQTKGYGMVFQKEKLEAFIKSQDQTLDENHIYKDEGYSGTLEIKDRPALKQLFEDARNNKFDVVYVYRLDRLFRKTKFLLGALDDLNKYNVGFRSITESFDTTNITGKFMTTLLGAVAEMERDTIRERTVNGRTSAAKAGKWAVGTPPYGFIKDPTTKKLVIVEKEAEIIRMLYDWLVYEKMSLKKITERINRMGINTPKYHIINKRKTHNYWYERTVGRILSNEIYTGNAFFRKFLRPYKNARSVRNKNLQRPKEEWIEIKVDPIITRELYDKSIDQLIRNQENAERNTKQDYLYSRLLHCGYCNFKMFSGYQPAKKGRGDHCVGTKYYHGVHRKKNAVGTTKRCLKCPQYAETRLEPIWDCLVDILKNPVNLRAPLERYKFKTEDKDQIKVKIENNNRKIASLESKMQKLGLLFVNNESMDMKEFKQLENECRTEKESLEIEDARLNQSLLTKVDVANREVVLKGMYEQIKDKIDNATYKDKQHIVHLFIERITLYARSNQADVVFRFPNTTVLANTRLDVPQKNTSLFLSIQTFSEKEIRTQILKSNPLMYKGGEVTQAT